ncbi:Uncharacterised protein [Mycobacterium tuberculosis]|uniref:Uncharacterized protein n=1 Tax=Mycobacterium tuberculosis TaxID=1773 RepID=A0A655FLL1_MYCTX|nr:Uncharacterised protein [Mycobacterium tuberculosis]CFS33699.1 Uncharacterised protein [Mycobacterium tuberculosis]CKQ19005.1 Uncharacterised protein [Mycobacterium tuberculosis]CNV34948.1 Uncharacterised protein [Mycobacterium tuberculosis]CNV80828.1 Uncharacterised protein [Mycobacterium tuberculosis]
MAARNEILRGNTLPAMTIPATTAIRIASGTGFFTSANPRQAWPTNSDRTPKIMNTFHSSGTPIGMAVRIPR